MIGTQMKYLTIPLLMTLTMCTAPVTHPTQASEWEKQQPYPGMLPDNSQVINSWIQDIKQWELEQTLKDPAFDINNALAEYFNGSDDPAEQEELLQLPSSQD
tara:strand:+ start:1012 stop:1317 length:306 start_codon:yes stop_codon:yes gene_type:complete